VPSAEELVQQIRSGSSDAEQELAAQFMPRVRAFLSSRTSNQDFVEEVTQETLMAVLRVLREGRFRNESSVGTFIYSIARNQLAEAYRKKARDKSVQLPEDLDAASPLPEAPAEWRHAARSELEALEPADRNLLWLILVEGFRPEEITSRLGLSADAIRQRKSRMLRKLAEKLGRLSQTEPVVRPIRRGLGPSKDSHDL
jgi:RNA polymerase sigma-70 factor, ECF subfamily